MMRDQTLTLGCFLLFLLPILMATRISPATENSTPDDTDVSTLFRINSYFYLFPGIRVHSEINIDYFIAE
jgi:hypothetical protein